MICMLNLYYFTPTEKQNSRNLEVMASTSQVRRNHVDLVLVVHGNILTLNWFVSEFSLGAGHKALPNDVAHDTEQ
jgi:hypothetical protein